MFPECMSWVCAARKSSAARAALDFDSAGELMPSR